MDAYSVSFLQKDLIPLLSGLDPSAPARWGKMNAQQMVEHLDDFFQVSIEKVRFPLSIPEEHLVKYREFLFSEKEFRENTKAPANVLGEEPLPLRRKDMAEAIGHLKKSIEEFFHFYHQDSTRKALHPAFGELDYEAWLILHGKHVRHHLRQFGLL